MLRSRSALYLCLLSSLSLLWACQSESEVSVGCVPNQTLACLCVGGKTGVQTCNAEGSAYSVCAGCAVGAVSDGGLDATSEATGAIGALGTACSPVGSLGCAGNHQKLTLLCGTNGTWEKNTTCAGDQFCDSTVGANAGSCQSTPKECVGEDPGFRFCTSEGSLMECTFPDAVGTNALEACKHGCADGKCKECSADENRCNGLVPQACADGWWKDWQANSACKKSCVVKGGVAQCE